MPEGPNRTVAFFDSQFERQTRAGDFTLNPFEKIALPYLQGRVLDMGCGLGNLSIEAARRGCSVVALDASPNAIARIKRAASAEALAIRAEQVDFESYRLSEMFDTVVAIGLFMFFPKKLALELLADAQAHVVAGGLIIVNVLVEGTTYLDMFEPGHYYLFGEAELLEHFKDWNIIESRHDSFPAPGETVKEFMTIIADR
ncbi:MAG: SAM-dependent methyltransferase [Candidatus Binatia bacterium]